MVRFTLKLIVILVFFQSSAQGQWLGVRTMAMGQTQTNQQDEEALFSNMAGLSGQKSWGLLSIYHLPFNLNELATLGLGLVAGSEFPLGISLMKTGRASYQVQSLAISMAKSLGPLSVGSRLTYWLISITGVAQDHGYTLDLGAQLKLGAEIQVGILIKNINQSEIFFQERLPASYHVGCSYFVGDVLTLSVDLSKNLELPPAAKFGLEYRVQGKILLRTGVDTSTRTTFAGVGMESPVWLFDYALGIHPVLGYSHQVGLKVRWAQH